VQCEERQGLTAYATRTVGQQAKAASGKQQAASSKEKQRLVPLQICGMQTDHHLSQIRAVHSQEGKFYW